MTRDPHAREVDDLFEEWEEIRPRIEAPDDDQGALHRALTLSRRCDALAREVSIEQLARINRIRTWMIAQDLPTNMRNLHPLTREEVVELLRENSGADVAQALTERFAISDDDLKLNFKVVLGEDVFDAARRAQRYLAAKPKGAIAREVREAIDFALDSLLQADGEVVR